MANLSEEIAVVLLVIYGLSLLFTLRTRTACRRRPARRGTTAAAAGTGHEPDWGVGRSLGVLLAATAGVAVMSEWLVGAVEHAGHAAGDERGVRRGDRRGDRRATRPSTRRPSWWRGGTGWTWPSRSPSGAASRWPCSSPRCWCSPAC